MNDLTDLQLIDHYLGRDEELAHRQVDAALATSADLKRRYDELAATWELLGKADISLPEADLWSGVASRLRYQPQGPVILAPLLAVPYWARAAAAVILAACVGAGTGLLRSPGDATAAPPAVVTEAEVSEQLYLDALASNTVQGLGDILLSETQSTEQ
ncbi:MAG: hypothetical protein ACYTFO_05750 [Planctomycetota bacterium]|jgi:hypothetical protein